MKKSLGIKRLTALLLLLAMGLSLIGCNGGREPQGENDPSGDSSISDGSKPTDGNKPSEGNPSGGNQSDGDVSAVAGAQRSFTLATDDEKEITLADYVNANGLDNITYEIKTNRSDAITLSPVTDGRFTVTAGAVSEPTNAVVSITVYRNGAEKLTVELSFVITQRGGYVPDDNVDADW